MATDAPSARCAATPSATASASSRPPREVFAERGLGVTLDDIAHHAGVGVGTVYRRFPDKEQLIDALFEARIEELVAVADAGLPNPDALAGLVHFLERGLELQAGDRGLKELCSAPASGPSGWPTPAA